MKQRIFRPLQNTQTIFTSILLFGLLAITARPALDPDLWWHLRTGQMIVETSHVPHTDPFSFTRSGNTWVAHEWLSDVLFYELWKHGSAAALIVFSAIVTTAGFMLLYLRCVLSGAKPHWAAAVTVIGALAAAPCWGVRPQMFSFAFCSLLLYLLEGGEQHPRRLLWIVPLFLLWLNLHAGFALAPVLMLAYAAGLTIETAVGDTNWLRARPFVLRIVLLLLACLVLVPLNPSGAQLYRYPFDTLQSSGMRSLIVEWFSPDFHQSLYLPLLLLWLSLLAALAMSRSRPETRMMIPLLLTGFAALDAVRHIPIFVLVGMPVLAAALPVTSKLSIPRQWRPVSPSRPLFNGAVVVLIAVFAVTRWVTLARTQEVREAEQFPEKAVEFLQSGNYPRNVFAYYDWGGYTIWKLYPQYRVFVDGRADLYGDDLLGQFQTAVHLRTGWQEVLDRWKIRSVFVPTSCALAQALLLDPKWDVAFRDFKAVVLLRKHPPAESMAYLPVPLVTTGAKKCSPHESKSAKLRHIRTWGEVSTPIPQDGRFRREVRRSPA